MLKTVLALTLLLIVKVLAKPTSLYENTRIIEQESACAEQGGMCREKLNCNPSEIVRVADLCPNQSSRGVVCCYYF